MGLPFRLHGLPPITSNKKTCPKCGCDIDKVKIVKSNGKAYKICPNPKCKYKVEIVGAKSDNTKDTKKKKK